MAAYNNRLYLGTNNSDGWTKKGLVRAYNGSGWTDATPGWSDRNDFPMVFAVYKGLLYTVSENGTSGAEVWRYNGATWENVTPGWGASTYKSFSICVFEDGLYVGTDNSSGAQVWRFDGALWKNVSPAWSGFASVEGMAVYNGRLYVGTGYLTTAQVWSYDGAVWQNVSPSWTSANTGCRATAVFNGRLYVGTFNSAGAQIWSYDGTTWSNVSPTWGAANYRNASLASYSGRLYASTSNHDGSQVWVYDGHTWTTATPGWTPNNKSSSLGRYKGRLFASTSTDSGAAQVWQLLDGPVDRDDCTAVIGADLSISIPCFTYGGYYLRAAFSYGSNPAALDFNIVDAAILDDPTLFAFCSPAQLSDSLVLHVPKAFIQHPEFNTLSIRFDLVYANEGAKFSMSGLGVNP